ncbi:MAG: class IV adenylate cyclase [Desulfurococcaceae archaeon]
MAPKLEREIKLRLLGPLDEVEAWASLAGFVKLDECYEEDVYFSHPCRDFGKSDEALRLRISRCAGRGEEYTLTYKGRRLSRGQLKERLELEARLPGPEAQALRTIIEALGFEPLATIKKHRKRYARGSLELAVDAVEGLGHFAELEGEDVGELEEALEALRSSLKGGAEPVEKTYLEMVLELGRGGA